MRYFKEGLENPFKITNNKWDSLIFFSRRNSYISSKDKEEPGTKALDAPETSLKRQGSRRRVKKKGDKEKTKLNKRRLSFRGMIGQSVNQESEKDDIEDLANAILDGKSEKQEKPNKRKN